MEFRLLNIKNINGLFDSLLICQLLDYDKESAILVLGPLVNREYILFIFHNFSIDIVLALQRNFSRQNTHSMIHYT